MAMSKSEELMETARVVFAQLSEIGFDIILSAWEIYDDGSQSAKSWLTFDQDAREFFTAYATFEEFESDPLNRAHLQSWRNNEDFFIWTLEGEVLEANLQFLAGLKEKQQLSGTLPSLGKKNRVYASAARFNRGYLTIGTNEPLSEEELGILHRMSRAFELAYRRFEDLQKAEAQAREAQIEAALERIRAQAMAMRESRDLLEIMTTIHAEFRGLGFRPGFVWHMRWGIETYEKASTNIDGSRVESVMILPRHFSGNKALKAWEMSSDPIGVFHFDPDEAVGYINAMIEKGKMLEISGLDEPPSHDMIRQMGGFTFVQARTGHGEIGYFLPGQLEPSQEAKDIFVRFARAFDMAYRRFEDLLQAEAQAREARIEAAVERIRAQAMAMHSSDDLVNVAQAVRKEMLGLGLEHSVASTISIVTDDDRVQVTDISSIDERGQFEHLLSVLEYNSRDSNYLVRQKLGWDRGEAYYVVHFEEEEMPLLADDVTKMDADMGAYLRTAIDEGLVPEMWTAVASFQRGYIGADFVQPPGDDVATILPRIAASFDLAYRRYEDLKQAEAQAHEAQIEAALERIRTQNLLMQHSSELVATSAVFHDQLQVLGVATEISYVWLPDEATEKHQFWATWTSEKDGEPAHISRAITYDLDRSEPYTAACFSAWERNDPIHIERIPPEDIEHFFTTWEELTGGAAHLRPEQFPEGIYYAEGYMRYGCFGINIRQEPTDAERDIILRFALEFERAYTRFLELKRAEAQAREAQIEASLERIRTRAMAMHASTDLLDIVVTMHAEYSRLGFEPGYFWHMKWTPTTYEKAMTSGDGSQIGMVMELPRGFHENAEMNAWELNDEPIGVFQFDADGAVDYVNRMIEQGKFLEVDPNAPSEDDIRHIGGITFVMARTTHGEIGYSLPGVADPTLDSLAVLARFASAFDLAYKRFEDLQQAEAQTREAQIEAALERVRASAMAMHTSEELLNVVTELRHQMDSLNQLELCFIHLYEDDSDMVESMSASRIPDAPDEIYTCQFQFPRQGIKIIEEVMALYHSDQRDYMMVVDGEQNLEWRGVLKQYAPDVYETFRTVLEADGDKPITAYWSFSDFTGGSMGLVTHQPPIKDSGDLLRRAANVFDLAYRRFRDLKLAEAQAREARIGIAVERVLAKAMAMHESQDLLGVAVALREEMLGLELPGVSASTIYLNQENGCVRLLDISKVEGEMHIEMDFTFDPKAQDPELFFHDILNTQEDYFVAELDLDAMRRAGAWTQEHGVQNLEEFYEYLDGGQCAGLWIPSVPLEKGKLCVDFLEPPPEEVKHILPQMASAFDLAYKRFEDLLQAEAQTRDAQIGLAVERVRAKALAMHQSEDILHVVTTLRDEMRGLNLVGVASATIYLEEEGGMVRVADITDFEDSDSSNPFTSEAIFDPEEVSPDIFANRIWHAQGAYTVIELNKDDMYAGAEFARQFPDVEKAADDWVELLDSGALSYLWITVVPLEHGKLCIDFTEPPPEEMASISPRMAAAFDLAYTRFEDLKNAENRAREAQIEAALERIRSRTMGMRASHEIADVMGRIFDEMIRLDMVLSRCLMWVFNEKEKYVDWWTANPEAENEATCYKMDYVDHPVFNAYHEAWQDRRPIWLYTLEGENKVSWDDHLFGNTEMSQVPEEVQAGMREPDTVYLSNTCGDFGVLMAGSLEQLSEENLDIVQRFGRVFQQAYARFLDVQRAETQARDAQIGLAIERVRAKALAMHKSEEIIGVSIVLREELLGLGLEGVSASTIYLRQDDGLVRAWDITRVNESAEAAQMTFDILFDPEKADPDLFFQPILRSTDDYFVGEMTLEGLRLAAEWVREYDAEGADELLEQMEANEITHFWIPSVPLENGKLCVESLVEPSDELKTILPQMAAAFDLAYKRFEDLQKAEAQAREAQIDAALERVRSRTMAMHRSEELADIVGKMFEELTLLDFELTRCIIWIFDQEKNVDWWMANPEAESGAECFDVPFNEHPCYQAHLQAWQNQQSELLYELAGQEKVEFDDFLFSDSGLANVPESVQYGMREPDTVYISNSINKFGSVMASGLEPLSNDNLEIVHRFGRVFQQSYTRFIDVQRAEAQAREAQIEAAMERIRARAMAMQSSEELIEVATELRQQMDALGQDDLQACVIHLYEEGSDHFRSLSATRPPGDDGELIPGDYSFSIAPHESLVEMMSKYASSETEYSIVLDKEQGDRWQAHMMREAPELGELLEEYLGDIPAAKYSQYWNFSDFSGGSVLMVTHARPTGEARDLLKRSAKVVDLAYRRFLDLKQAEEQAREARIEASLERVRGRAMAMQEPENLGEVSILMFDELAELGVSTLRSGISIPLDNERYEFRAATKTEDGTTTLVFGNESINVHPIIRRAFEGWKSQEEFQSILLAGEDLVEYYHAVFDTMPLPDWKERMKTGADGQEGFSTFPFSDGWLYAFSSAEMHEDQIDIFVRFAKVFGLAYQRYHDLTQAEKDYKALLDEKAKTEKALSDLQATQAQLVEQQKLASLGSLTAGIAHEIKNPLNFVNNFAEVSAELTVELADAVATGNLEEVKAILTDLQQNAAQISKHGKRADSIVRSMMQHARGGTSERETIDVNQFIDEYVGLAWHGMRARSHGFQAEVEKILDENVGSISAQPQELGRVILNLLNNAFQAVSDGTTNPTVRVSTMRDKDTIEVVVADNGPGIPEEIRDKIFEPFFTTKATGEGTGLGLSLSYDIVTKGHGGTMTIGQAPDGGAVFTIQLPAPKE